MLNVWHSCRFLFLFLCLPIYLISSIPLGQCLPDESGNVQHSQILWCSIQHPATQRVFISEPVASSMHGHLPLWNAGNHFINVINARYTLTIRGGDRVCNLYPNRRRALKARDLTRALAEKQGWQVMNIGSY